MHSQGDNCTRTTSHTTKLDFVGNVCIHAHVALQVGFLIVSFIYLFLIRTRQDSKITLWFFLGVDPDLNEFY